MKIGILTFHRAHNYGAVLQCYALQQYLIKLGHDTYVIDYNNRQLWADYDWRDQVYEKKIVKNIIKLPFRFFLYIKNRRWQILRYYKFVHFQERMMKLATERSIEESPYDLILIGSDQVWNTSITHGLDPYYWGKFEKPLKTKVATYAASFKGLWKEEMYDEIRDALNGLDKISVRESKVGEYVKALFPEIQITCVPDPVLLLSQEQWKAIAKPPKNISQYAFFYQAGNSDVAYRTAADIASKYGLPLVSLSSNKWTWNSKECISASPQEFLGWILKAKLIITSSFHALAYCILFQKDFYAIQLDKKHDERLKNLTKLFGLENRVIENESQFMPLAPFDNSDILKRLRMEADTYIASLV